ncbi:MAG: hypothetical protein AAF438_03145 [Pseudomonadota bacterium]
MTTSNAVRRSLTLSDLPAIPWSPKVSDLVESEPFADSDLVLSWILALDESCDYWVHLRDGAHQIQIGFVKDSHGDMDFDWRNYDSPQRELAWCASHEKLVHMLSNVFLCNWEFESFCQPSNEIGHYTQLGFRVTQDKRVLNVGTIRSPADLLERIHCEPSVITTLPTIRIRLPLAIDEFEVTAGEVKFLKTGAFIPIEQSVPDYATAQSWQVETRSCQDLWLKPIQELNHHDRECFTDRVSPI